MPRTGESEVPAPMAMLCYMAGNNPKAAAIGADLRRARQAAHLTQRQLAEKLGWNYVRIHRAETGERPLPATEVGEFLAAVEAPVELAAKLVDMTHDAGTLNPWWGVGTLELQRQIDALLELESVATAITAVAPLLVPGLLQTPDYTRRIMVQAGVPA